MKVETKYNLEDWVHFKDDLVTIKGGVIVWHGGVCRCIYEVQFEDGRREMVFEKDLGERA